MTKRMSKLCGLLLAVAVCVVPASVAFAVPIFSVSAPNYVAQTQTFKINVAVSGAVDLYDYQFDLNFDPAKVQYVAGGVEGPFLATAGPTFFFGGIPSPGSVQFVFDTLLGGGPGATGSGFLASFDFKALLKGPTTFSLSNVIAQDTPGNVLAITLAPPTTITVPEPGTLGLLALAMVGCMVSARKRLGAHSTPTV